MIVEIASHFFLIGMSIRNQLQLEDDIGKFFVMILIYFWTYISIYLMERQEVGLYIYVIVYLIYGI